MSNHLAPPASITNAYTVVADGWTRSTAWVRSSRSDHFEAIYIHKTTGPKAVKVYIRSTYIVDATAAVFEINMQIRRAKSMQRKRDSRKRA